jgi:hypothetical protein
MWNSNSVISWLLARSGLPTNAIGPPAGGRAPGWQAGLVTARRQQRSDEGAGHGTGGATERVGGRGWQRIQPLLDVKRRAEELATGRQSAAMGAVAWEVGTALETSVITPSAAA